MGPAEALSSTRQRPWYHIRGSPLTWRWLMATQASQTTPMIPQGRSLTAEEATEVQENLARANFGMSLAEFVRVWKAGEFDNDRERHSKVVSLAMLVPECWDD